MTIEEAKEIMRRGLPGARKVASAAGSIHPLWDAIFDAENFLEGKQTLLSGDPEYVAGVIAQSLKPYGESA